MVEGPCRKALSPSRSLDVLWTGGTSITSKEGDLEIHVLQKDLQCVVFRAILPDTSQRSGGRVHGKRPIGSRVRCALPRFEPEK